jgi:cystathionine beta-synthase
VWGIDTYGSVFKKYHETGIFDPNEIYPYITEGIGEDILPLNVDFKLIDHFEKVTDKDAAIGTRNLARLEGVFVGNSAGSAIMGVKQMAAKLTKDDVVVVLFHDHGSRYVGKMFNDDWMRDRGFLDDELTVSDIITRKRSKVLLTLNSTHTVKEALKFMKEKDISQLPVVNSDNLIVGAITESVVLSSLLENPIVNADRQLGEIMSTALPEVDEKLPLKKLSYYFNEKILLAVIALHLCAILYYQKFKHENLIKPMLLGDKEIDPSDRAKNLPDDLGHTSQDGGLQRGIALIVLSLIAVTLGYFITQ